MNEVVRRYPRPRNIMRTETVAVVEDRPDSAEFLGTALTLPSFDQLVALYGEATASIRTRMFDLWEALNEHRSIEGDHIFAFDPANPKLVENFQDMAEKFEWFRLYGARDGFLVFQQRLISISFAEPAEKQMVVTVAPWNDRVQEGAFFSGFRVLVIGRKLIYCRPITVGQELSTRTGIRLRRHNLCLRDGTLASAPVDLSSAVPVERAIGMILNTAVQDSFFADVYMHNHEINVDLKLVPVGAYPDVDVQAFKDDLSNLLHATRDMRALDREWTTEDSYALGTLTSEQFQPLAVDAARRGVKNPTGAQLIEWAWQIRLSGGITPRPVFLKPYVISHHTEPSVKYYSSEFDEGFEQDGWGHCRSRVSPSDGFQKTRQSFTNFDLDEFNLGDTEKLFETNTSTITDFFKDLLTDED